MVNIKAYNDGRKVYEGALEKFLEDNQWDRDLVYDLRNIEIGEEVVINYYHSGEWKFVRTE